MAIKAEELKFRRQNSTTTTALGSSSNKFLAALQTTLLLAEIGWTTTGPPQSGISSAVELQLIPVVVGPANESSSWEAQRRRIFLSARIRVLSIPPLPPLPPHIKPIDKKGRGCGHSSRRTIDQCCGLFNQNPMNTLSS